MPPSSILTRRLVVNADDLGLTVGVNDGIFDAHERGIVTSASVFANASATGDAIRRARNHSSLGLGVHLTLVDGVPTLPPSHVPSLVEDDGRFRASWKSFVLACVRGHVAFDEAERELSAQIDRIRAEGLRLTHLDAHKHVHTFPPLFAIVVRLASRYEIPAVRVPYEPRPSLYADAHHRRTARRQWLANVAMRPWAKRDHRMAAAHGVRAPEFAGRVQTGIMNARSLDETLRHVGAGVTELMVHPGYVDEPLRAARTRLMSSREEEVRLLCADTTRDLIDREAIQLVRHDLTSPDPAMTRRAPHVS